eukprot:gene15645-21152_t
MKAPSSNSSSFSAWLEAQKQDGGNDRSNDNGTDITYAQSAWGYFSQFGSIQENFTNQLQELSGSLPEAGPLSAAFRARVTNAIYLLIASGVFTLLAIFIGLPTILLRPAKFVLCLTLATLFAASSVIVMIKPSTFLSDLLKFETSKTAPIALLLISLLFTLYVTLVVHKYLYVLFAGIFQVMCLLYYLASFIPGGSRGLTILLKTCYLVVSTAMKPCIFIVKRTTRSFIRTVFSS